MRVLLALILFALGAPAGQWFPERAAELIENASPPLAIQG
jgi:hypothetical protein